MVQHPADEVRTTHATGNIFLTNIHRVYSSDQSTPSPDGGISNYFPDFFVKLTDGRVIVVETKGREDLDVPLKMQRLRRWCEDVNKVIPDVTYDFVYVDQESFDLYRPETFQQLLDGFTEYKSTL